MLFDIQQLRNLTTGRLHTSIDHIYTVIGTIVGENGIMTHMIPGAVNALKPYLQQHTHDARFFDGLHDPTHVGTVDIPVMSDSERAAFFVRYEQEPNPLLERLKSK